MPVYTACRSSRDPTTFHDSVRPAVSVTVFAYTAGIRTTGVDPIPGDVGL